MASSELNFVIDSHIPFIKGVLEPFGRVRYLAPAQIDAAAVRDADALLVRTRTRCDERLLGSAPRCRFVGTATIGLDHIDREYCAGRGIAVTNAPGCNAPAVAQYVYSAIGHLINRPVGQYTLGIVGVGHVGSIVKEWAEGLGMRVLCCDPPRQRAGDAGEWVTLEDIAAHSDIVTMHTPLTRTGQDATFHLAGREFFRSLRRCPIFINAARGPVTDTAALLEAIDTRQVFQTVIDTWEGEPCISPELLERATIATPHIAGYSLDGKVRATRMVLDKLSETLGLPHLDMPGVRQPVAVPGRIRLRQAVDSYNIMADDRQLRRSPATFEAQRDNYPLRDEIG